MSDPTFELVQTCEHPCHKKDDRPAPEAVTSYHGYKYCRPCKERISEAGRYSSDVYTALYGEYNFHTGRRGAPKVPHDYDDRTRIQLANQWAKAQRVERAREQMEKELQDDGLEEPAPI